MRFSSDPSESQQRLAAAHATVAALALAGAVAMQASWTAARSGAAGYVGLTIVMTTAWLLSTAWLHRQVAQRESTTPRALIQAGGDLAVSIVAGTLLFQGHASPLAAVGLWLVPPVLLAIGATSAVVLAIAAMTASNQPAAESSIAHEACRIAIWIGLLAAVGLLVAKPFP